METGSTRPVHREDEAAIKFCGFVRLFDLLVIFGWKVWDAFGWKDACLPTQNTPFAYCMPWLSTCSSYMSSSRPSCSLLLAPFSTILSLCMSMITLLDVLSLPSCGFSSKERYLRPEILRCYAHLSNCEPNMIDQNSFNTIMETLFEKIIRRKMNKEKFLKYEKKWLESQQLQLVRILIFLLFKLQLY